MTPLNLSLVLGLAVATSGARLNSSHGSDFAAAKASAQTTVHLGEAPFAGIETGNGAGFRWVVNTIYAAPQGRTAWTIRSVVGGRNLPVQILWADSQDCPAVAAALTRLARLAQPSVDVPGTGVSPPRDTMLDGTDYRFWSRATYASGATGELELRGNDSLPVARWWEATNDTLANDGCWKPAEPRG